MKKNSLKRKIFLYLALFAFIILCGIWFLQILSLDIYYEYSKQSEIKGIATKVEEAYKNSDNNAIDSLAYEKDVCIELTQNNNIYYSTDSLSRGCLVNDSQEINNYKLNFMLSGDKKIIYKVINPKFKNKTLIYGLKIDDGIYAFISTSLEPISSLSSLLKKQLIIILVIVLIIAAIIAYTISKKISAPIEEITNISKNISKGIYNVKFDTKTDINEIKELESTLNIVADEFSKTDEIRRELLANVSHDLKTPLTLIKANAEMVRDLTYTNEEKRDKNLNTIINEVDRLNLLVEDILDLSKMQSQAFHNELNYENVNLNDIIKEIISRFDIIEKDGYKINYEGFDIIVCVDKKKIEQVIYNLINNAINYTGDDKQIYIKLVNNKSFVRIEVIDTGKGIDDKDLKYIWDKYYKVDKKYKRVSYGTGLGLSIVKNILINHNFNYGVISKKDMGTKFYFDIKILKNKKM